MAPENAVPEDKLNEFVTRLREAAGANLESVILFGSARDSNGAMTAMAMMSNNSAEPNSAGR